MLFKMIGIRKSLLLVCGHFQRFLHTWSPKTHSLMRRSYCNERSSSTALHGQGQLRSMLKHLWHGVTNKKQTLKVRRIRKVWRVYVGLQDSFFVRVIYNACIRDTDLSNYFFNGPHTTTKNQPQEIILANLAENFYKFFDCLITENVLRQPHLIKEMSFDLGRKHAYFSHHQYNLTHWDTINLAMMEEMENAIRFDEIDLRAWQTLIAIVFEHMYCGYLKGKEEVRQSKAN